MSDKLKLMLAATLLLTLQPHAAHACFGCGGGRFFPPAFERLKMQQQVYGETPQPGSEKPTPKKASKAQDQDASQKSLKKESKKAQNKKPAPDSRKRES